ncbi:crossover junction endonuclease MUS81-like [Ctenocephalides felis]|uniref:crossover junction endonuclease MUS81-like n=1 Tax=Ctenocephalides felis TaxID=7515 RepID=UPI000E6E4EE1|nr:crossover junction endonuclease MUS81-like [Ctenocephalides felis]
MEEPSVIYRRIYYRLKEPNPLFTKWVEELKNEAEKKNSKSKFILAEALDSLKKFPLPLESGRDCIILRGFGKTLCSMLDDKLEEYKRTNNSPSSLNSNNSFSLNKDLSKKTKFASNKNISFNYVENDKVYEAEICNDISDDKIQNLLDSNNIPHTSTQNRNIDTLKNYEIRDNISSPKNVHDLLNKYKNLDDLLDPKNAKGTVNSNKTNKKPKGTKISPTLSTDVGNKNIDNPSSLISPRKALKTIKQYDKRKKLSIEHKFHRISTSSDSEISDGDSGGYIKRIDSPSKISQKNISQEKRLVDKNIFPEENDEVHEIAISSDSDDNYNLNSSPGLSQGTKAKFAKISKQLDVSIDNSNKKLNASQISQNSSFKENPELHELYSDDLGNHRVYNIDTSSDSDDIYSRSHKKPIEFNENSSVCSNQNIDDLECPRLPETSPKFSNNDDAYSIENFPNSNDILNKYKTGSQVCNMKRKSPNTRAASKISKIMIMTKKRSKIVKNANDILSAKVTEYEDTSANKQSADTSPEPSEVDFICNTNSNQIINNDNNISEEKGNQNKLSNNINSILDAIDNNKKPEAQKRGNSKTSKLYSPAYRSGPYALLIALIKLHHENKFSVSKDELQTKAQPYCDKVFVPTDKSIRYTAWSSMSTLITKNLVQKTGRPAKFSITEDGISVAEELLKKYVETNQEGDFEDNIGQQVSTSQKETLSQKNKRNAPKTTEIEAVIFPPNSFEIILLVDTQETSGMAKRAYDETIQVLTEIKVQYEIRRLNVGDFAWICRDDSKRELLLPYIVERKRMDDFGSSIRDGRFKEQKFRLKQCGIQNLLYLIESYGRNEHTGLPIASLFQAACNTSIQDDFILKFTNTHRDSMMYLAVLTRMLMENISNKTLVSCPKENLKKFDFNDTIIALMDFTEFQNSSKKTRKYTVQNMFVKHLMRIKGISMDKALAIVAKHPTPQDLYEAFNASSSTINKDLLTNIQCGPLNRKIGPAMSETLYHLFTLEKYS